MINYNLHYAQHMNPNEDYNQHGSHVIYKTETKTIAITILQMFDIITLKQSNRLMIQITGLTIKLDAEGEGK